MTLRTPCRTAGFAFSVTAAPQAPPGRVERNWCAHTSGTVTTGTINPGFLWIGKGFQIGVEALIPINRQSGTNVGVIGQLHFYLDDLFPNSIGKPISQW